MQATLLAIARCLDSDDTAAAEAILTEGGQPGLPASGRRALLGLWRRFLKRKEAGRADPAEAARVADALCAALDLALKGGDRWPIPAACDAAEPVLGNSLLAPLLAGVLWDDLARAPYGFAYDILSRVFLGENRALFSDFFDHVLTANREFVPDYWLFQSLMRTWAESGTEDPGAALQEMLARTRRQDLAPLFTIYLEFVRQLRSDRAQARAAQLTDPVHRERLAAYLLGASQSERTIGSAVDLHRQICDDPQGPEHRFMRARKALCDANWDLVRDLTDDLVRHPRLGREAVCLRAMAHAHLGDDDNAAGAVNHVRYGARSAWFLRARASAVNVTRRLLRDGQPALTALPAPALDLGPGRPLAQSLWIGPRLRWIELMSIASFLANGWRYKLYVYDIPENVPEGVELADAASVLPRAKFFREGASSGMHKGSVGAFSDLFRYAMISRMGGMWTDTDVINLRPFEPAGARIISTERTDAGLLGLNGAMMAAPAGDPLQSYARDEAERRLETERFHFGRVGPELLADLIGDGGVQGYDLLPVDFLNPIGWMETGTLLRPTDEVQAGGWLRNANNIHVYTETWRLIGLDLKAPPGGGSFLADLFSRLMAQDTRAPRPVLELMAA